MAHRPDFLVAATSANAVPPTYTNVAAESGVQALRDSKPADSSFS
jgi:hypothetical protein